MASGCLAVAHEMFHARRGLVVALQPSNYGVAQHRTKVRVFAERLVGASPQRVLREIEDRTEDPRDACSLRVAASDAADLVDQVGVKAGTAVDLLTEDYSAADVDGTVHRVDAVDHRVPAVLLHGDLLDAGDDGAPLGGVPAPLAIDLAAPRGVEVGPHVHLGVRAHRVLVQRVVAVEHLRDGDLCHLAQHLGDAEAVDDSLGL